jgi:hypothetical protein
VNNLAEKTTRKSSLTDARASATPEELTVANDVEEEEELDEKTMIAAQLETMAMDEDIEEEDEEEDELTVMEETSVLPTRPRPRGKPRDSLVSELLSDDDDVL